MLKLLERSIATVANRMVVLAPPNARVPMSLHNQVPDLGRHADLMRDVQAFRGRIYMNDGALRPEHLTKGGLHQTPEDDRAWHIVLFDALNQVTGCIWYLEHDGTPSLEQLRVKDCPLARAGESRERLRAAIDAEVSKARSEGVGYAEVGGWAISKCSKPTDCLLAILATYSLSQLIGGAFVIATATIRNSSAPILRRMGGSSLVHDGAEIPRYYDPRYRCDMEILRFDTRQPAARFSFLVKNLASRLMQIPVITTSELAEPQPIEAWAPSTGAHGAPIWERALA